MIEESKQFKDLTFVSVEMGYKIKKHAPEEIELNIPVVIVRPQFHRAVEPPPLPTARAASRIQKVSIGATSISFALDYLRVNLTKLVIAVSSSFSLIKNL